MLVLGLNSNDRKLTRDKANISKPKLNGGCAPLTANRISTECVQISLGPSIPYIPLGVYHTRGFNAMQPLNFENRWIIPSHTLPSTSMLGIKLIHVSNRGPGSIIEIRRVVRYWSAAFYCTHYRWNVRLCDLFNFAVFLAARINKLPYVHWLLSSTPIIYMLVCKIQVP